MGYLTSPPLIVQQKGSLQSKVHVYQQENYLHLHLAGSGVQGRNTTSPMAMAGRGGFAEPAPPGATGVATPWWE